MLNALLSWLYAPPVAFTAMLGAGMSILFARVAARRHQRRAIANAERAYWAMWEPVSPEPDDALTWCAGCDRLPEAWHMKWTDDGLYRCPACRATSAVQAQIGSASMDGVHPSARGHIVHAEQTVDTTMSGWFPVLRERSAFTTNGRSTEQVDMIDFNAEFTDEQLRASPYGALMAEAVVVRPDEYRSGPPPE